MLITRKYIGKTRIQSTAFTLVELLVVIGIIALLIAILLPTLNRARASATSIKCASNLRQIGLGLVLYNNSNKGYIIPSYNLPPIPGSPTNVTGGPSQILDGWVSILDRDGYVKSPNQSNNTMFYCPDTVDIEGMKDGQTGTDPGKPRGWTDWPIKFATVGGDGVVKVATTDPANGYFKIIRESYWVNAYNPIGNSVANLAVNDLFYTASVGFGPDSLGNYIRPHKLSSIKQSSRMIVVADGVYMGRQTVTQNGMTNSRIGFRHPGPKGKQSMANVVFADGHVEAISGNVFPIAFATTSSYTSNNGKTTLADQIKQNRSGYTIYADADAALAIFQAANPSAN